jgi:hypothetical protein
MRTQIDMSVGGGDFMMCDARPPAWVPRDKWDLWTEETSLMKIILNDYVSGVRARLPLSTN